MDKASRWLNRDFTAWLSKLVNIDSPQRSGVFVVRCEAEQRSSADVSAVGSRLERLLRAAAMRFAKQTSTVLGWTQTGATLIVAVTVSMKETDQADIEVGKLTYALRACLFGQFRTKYAQRERLDGRRVGMLRHGYGWIAKPGEASLRGFEEACAKVVRAVESAIGSMFEPGSDPLRLHWKEEERTSHRLATSIEARYAPIVSLLDGSLYGYEAVMYDRLSGLRIDLNDHYRGATEAGTLFESDRAFREEAIRGLPSRNGDVKLFLPVPANVVFDTRLAAGSTLRRIESAGLRPEHVVLVLYGGEEERGGALKAALGHYRMQGFRIALPGITANRTDLHRMLALQPDYALISLHGMGDDSPGPVEESLLQAMTALARKEQIVMIADGVNREDTLPLLVGGGLSYGLGAWIGEERIRTGQAAVSPHIQSRIRAEVQRRYRGATGSLSQLAIPVVRFPRQTPVSEIARYYELHREVQAIVIVENEAPVGLVMKEKMHQLLSGQFGLPLYWNRPVGKIMDAHPMIADESVSIDQVSQMAMAREPNKLYDAVIVTRAGKLSGIAFVQAMLEWVTRTRVEFAQWANPLTGLPGNVPIERELIRRLAEGKPFAIWYADLDHFKWFNDQYGFHNGDEIIRYTAEVLSEGVRDYDPKESSECFVGHVGGDDFIVMTAYADPVAAARLTLKRFESGIGSFVSGKMAGTVMDRNGQVVQGTGLSLSLALLIIESSEGWTPQTVSGRSAHLKRKSKQMTGNSLVWEVADSAYAEWSVT